MNQEAAKPPPLVAVVDDEEDITAFLAAALEDAGYRVVEINQADHALPSLRNEPPDLICLDLLMPHRTGASLYQEIRRDKRLAAAPVLVMSGLNARGELNEILAGQGGTAPPVGYLEKPIEVESFLAAVAELLGGARPDPKGSTP